MLSKINPTDIVRAHFRTFHRYDTGNMATGEITFHLLIPLAACIAHFSFAGNLSENVVSIIVSAASIVAGLMLNLLVLIYTLAFNANSGHKIYGNIEDFKLVTRECFATISYCVLTCIILVVAALLALSDIHWAANIGRALTIYTGVSAVLTVLMVLKRCYRMIIYELR